MTKKPDDVARQAQDFGDPHDDWVATYKRKEKEIKTTETRIFAIALGIIFACALIIILT